MWQAPLPIELPLKALRLQSLTLLRDLLSAGSWVDRHNPRSQVGKHGRQIPNPTATAAEPVKCQHYQENPQPFGTLRLALGARETHAVPTNLFCYSEITVPLISNQEYR